MVTAIMVRTYRAVGREFRALSLLVIIEPAGSVLSCYLVVVMYFFFFFFFVFRGERWKITG